MCGFGNIHEAGKSGGLTTNKYQQYSQWLHPAVGNF